MSKIPLLGLTLNELNQVVKNVGMPTFSAKQIAHWLYVKRVHSIDEMTNLSQKHREMLIEAAHSYLGELAALYFVLLVFGQLFQIIPENNGRG